MRTHLILIATVFCISTISMHAVELPVMAFTNTQVTQNIEFTQIETTGHYGGDPGILDARFGTPYSDSTPFLQTQTYYLGQDLYGGGERTMYDVSDPFAGQITRSRAQNNTGWRFDVRSTNSASWTAVCLMYVKKADFYYEGNLRDVDITDSSIFTATAENGFYYPSKDAVVRCFVKQGNICYLSEEYQNFLYRSAGAETFVFSNLASTAWAEYDPESSLLMDESSAFYYTLDLTNVSAVGMYFREIRDAPNVANVQWKIFECTVTADIVPEPGSIFIIAAGVIGLIRYRFKS